MATIIMLVLAMTAQNPPERHVRATEPRIRFLIATGLARSPTFRTLVARLDASDVVVYVEPKLTRQALGAFLVHHLVCAGGYRYLRVQIDPAGAMGRVVPVLAHELQHSIEVAQSAEIQDADSMARMFNGLSVPFACSATGCSESRGALDVESAVRREMKSRTVMAASVESGR
jgi:hypothetical protein